MKCAFGRKGFHSWVGYSSLCHLLPGFPIWFHAFHWTKSLMQLHFQYPQPPLHRAEATWLTGSFQVRAIAWRKGLFLLRDWIVSPNNFPTTAVPMQDLNSTETSERTTTEEEWSQAWTPPHYSTRTLSLWPPVVSTPGLYEKAKSGLLCC